jgi:hypothetical protein
VGLTFTLLTDTTLPDKVGGAVTIPGAAFDQTTLPLLVESASMQGFVAT